MVYQDKSLNSVEVPVIPSLEIKKKRFCIIIYTAATELFHVKCKKEGRKVKSWVSYLNWKLSLFIFFAFYHWTCIWKVFHFTFYD